MQHVRKSLSRLALFVAASMGLSCAVADPAGACRQGSDCESGVCQENQCVDAGGSGGQGAGSSVGGEGGIGGAGASASGGGTTTSTGGTGACSPNHDGTIERTEVVFETGLSAKFLAANDATFATSGQPMGNGARAWDMTGALPGDHQHLLETLDPSLGWYASVFPGATYAARLTSESNLLGVFEVTADKLLLKGVVSPTDGTLRTELEYDPPVVVLSFPLSEGKSWSTTSTVSGLAQGVIVAYTEQYDNSVDAHGTLKSPFGEFEVLRTRVTLERTVGLLTTTIRSYAFSSECFGTVATIRSQDNETESEFSSASEVLRLTP